MANDQAKIAIAKKAIYAGEVSPYATPAFGRLLQKAHKINEMMTTFDNETGCEFSEHYYLGHGNGGLEASDIKNWKATTTKNGVVRISFGTYNDNYLLEFVMQGNQIDDVKMAYSDNPKKTPTATEQSLREEAQKMVNTNSCGY